MKTEKTLTPAELKLAKTISEVAEIALALLSATVRLVDGWVERAILAYLETILVVRVREATRTVSDRYRSIRQQDRSDSSQCGNCCCPNISSERAKIGVWRVRQFASFAKRGESDGVLG
jgi:hypothetical protein